MARPNFNTKMAKAFFRHYEHKHHVMAAIQAAVASEIAPPSGFSFMSSGSEILTDRDGAYLVVAS